MYQTPSTLKFWVSPVFIRNHFRMTWGNNYFLKLMWVTQVFWYQNCHLLRQNCFHLVLVLQSFAFWRNSRLHISKKKKLKLLIRNRYQRSSFKIERLLPLVKSYHNLWTGSILKWVEPLPNTNYLFLFAAFKVKLHWCQDLKVDNGNDTVGNTVASDIRVTCSLAIFICNPLCWEYKNKHKRSWESQIS